MRFAVDRWWRRGLVAAAATALGLAGAAVPAHAQQEQQEDASEVYVVHGIPEQEVDVYVDDELTVESLAPEDVAGPLELPGGTYTVALTQPGQAVDEDPIVTSDVEVPSGENVSLTAHLSEEGEPTLTGFVNEVQDLPPDQARLTVRHVAAAPAVNVLVNGEEAITDLTNPNEQTQELPAETVSVEVVLANGQGGQQDEGNAQDPVIGPTDLNLSQGALTIAYAIGSADEDTLTLVVQTIEQPDAEQPGQTPTPAPTPETPQAPETPGAPDAPDQ
jgi:hypothetical protein